MPTDSISKEKLAELQEDFSSNLSYKDWESECQDWLENEKYDESVYPTIKPYNLEAELEEEKKNAKVIIFINNRKT